MSTDIIGESPSRHGNFGRNLTMQGDGHKDATDNSSSYLFHGYDANRSVESHAPGPGVYKDNMMSTMSLTEETPAPGRDQMNNGMPQSRPNRYSSEHTADEPAQLDASMHSRSMIANPGIGSQPSPNVGHTDEQMSNITNNMAGAQPKKTDQAANPTDESRLNTGARTESFAGMTQSERKRFREKKRRSDITNAIEELTKTVLKVDPGALISGNGRSNKSHYGSGGLDGIVTKSNSHQPPNRTEVINHACRLLEKLHQENEKNRFYIEKLSNLVGNGNQMAQTPTHLPNEIGLYPHHTGSASLGPHHDVNSRDHHGTAYGSLSSSINSAPDVLQHAGQAQRTSSQMHLGTPASPFASQSPSHLFHSSNPSSFMSSIGEHHTNVPGVGGNNPRRVEPSGVPQAPDQLAITASLLSSHHPQRIQPAPQTSAALLNTMNSSMAGGIANHVTSHQGHPGAMANGGDATTDQLLNYFQQSQHQQQQQQQQQQGNKRRKSFSEY